MKCYGIFRKILVLVFLLLVLEQMTLGASMRHRSPCKKLKKKSDGKSLVNSDMKPDMKETTQQEEVQKEEKSEEKSEVKPKPCKKPKEKSENEASEVKPHPTCKPKGTAEGKSAEKAESQSEVKSEKAEAAPKVARKPEEKSEPEDKSEQKSEQKSELKSEQKPRPPCKKPKDKTVEKSEEKSEVKPHKPCKKPKAKAEEKPETQTDEKLEEKPEIEFDKQLDITLPNDEEFGFNGNLYDVFKKHLNQVFRDLYNNVSLPVERKLREKCGIRKRATVSNCLYEEFKRRLDKFNNEFIMQPGKSFKRMSSEADGGSGEKRSTVQECLYEENKKRLDKIGNELSFDGEKAFDRSGRGVPDVYELVITKRAPVNDPTHSFEQENNRNFYEEYRNRLNELTRELYEKSNERIHRTYAHLGDDSMDSPTLRRWVLPKEKNSDLNVALVALQRNSRSEKHSTNEDDKKKDNEQAKARATAENKRSLGLDEIGTSIFGGDALPYGTGVSASYPSVLTKALETNIGMLGNTTPKNLLASVAQKMNMTTLELAKKLAAMSNPTGIAATTGKRDSQLATDFQNFIDLTLNKLTPSPETKAPPASKKSLLQNIGMTALTASTGSSTSSATPAPSISLPSPAPSSSPSSSSSSASLSSSSSASKSTSTPSPLSSVTTASSTSTTESVSPQPTPSDKCATPAPPSDKCAAPMESESSRIANVLEKVLAKLERLQMGKESAEGSENCEPDGVACDVTGSWNSYTMGLRFDISVGKAADRRLGLAEKNNKLLTVEVAERIPPRPHHIVATNWKFMGSALNQHGGPFFMYAQSREESTVVTFTGYCRSCNAIDTIFGLWTIMGPSKDCEDITTSLETKHDILRRYNMESKRKQRLKDILFDKSKYSKGECES